MAGLIPLVISSGAGAIGNKTIGGSALGGMLMGTFFGVLLVPGLYFVFGTLSNKRKLIKDQDEEPLSENIIQYESE